MSSALITTTLALISTGLMVYSALLAVRILRHLPGSGFLKWWRLLLIVIIGIAACYLVFALTVIELGQVPLAHLIGVLLFFSAVFVLLTMQLFIHTFSSAGKSNWLHKESIIDAATGIYNLRYFEMRLVEEFDRSRRYNSPLTLLLVEIDNFKINTTSYGLSTSQMALVTICRLLKDHSRTSDILARYGGEQVVILLPNTALFNARKTAEKYRSVMEDKTLDIDDDDSTTSVRLNFTVSIGIASLQNDIKRANELIRRADLALYKAKDRGRNRVAIYGE
ncbi:MAG: GGDEF domain-containing protein [Gammaproteobacteria bacterium]